MKILVFSVALSERGPAGARPVRRASAAASGRDGWRRGAVVAPVPWFPLELAALRRVLDVRAGCRTASPATVSRSLHPRYPLPPKIGMSAAPLSMALATLATVRAAAPRVSLRAHRCPLLLPGRCRRGAARQVARRAGHDHGARYRHQPDPALPRAARMDTLGGASLGREHRRLRGAAQRDGRARYRPRAHPRIAQRRRSAALPAVGSRRGARGARPRTRPLAAQRRAAHRAQGSRHPDRALADLPGWSLLVAGDGPLRRELEALARSLGLADRVRFAGAVPQCSCRPTTVPSTRSCWLRVAKAGPTCCSRRWPAERRSSRRRSGVRRRSSRLRPPAS